MNTRQDLSGLTTGRRWPSRGTVATRIDAPGRREESFDLMMFPGIGPATNGPRTVVRDSHDLNWTALTREWVHSHEGESRWV